MHSVAGKVISGIKNIIESHKAFSFRVEEYPENDILKIGLTTESSKLELNLVSYVCQVLQERGINIMLYVPRYAAVYSQEIVKYVDEVVPNKEELAESEEDELLQEEPEEKIDLSKIEKYLVVEENKPASESKVQPKTEQKVEMQGSGRTAGGLEGQDAAGRAWRCVGRGRKVSHAPSRAGAWVTVRRGRSARGGA